MWSHWNFVIVKPLKVEINRSEPQYNALHLWTTIFYLILQRMQSQNLLTELPVNVFIDFYFHTQIVWCVCILTSDAPSWCTQCIERAKVNAKPENVFIYFFHFSHLICLHPHVRSSDASSWCTTQCIKKWMQTRYWLARLPQEDDTSMDDSPPLPPQLT